MATGILSHIPFTIKTWHVSGSNTNRQARHLPRQGMPRTPGLGNRRADHTRLSGTSALSESRSFRPEGGCIMPYFFGNLEG